MKQDKQKCIKPKPPRHLGRTWQEFALNWAHLERGTKAYAEYETILAASRLAPNEKLEVDGLMTIARFEMMN